MSKNNPNYKFYTYTRKHSDGSTSIRTVAISSFAGNPVKGYADCREGDTFDSEYGKALAAARCSLKIAEKRCKRAENRLADVIAQAQTISKKMDEAVAYENNAMSRRYEIVSEINILLAQKQG